MSPNTISPFPKESDTPSEMTRKKIRSLDDTNQALVTTNDTAIKEGNTDMVYKEGKSKQNFVEKSITPLRKKEDWHSKKNI